jgi:gliding motility-associated-like protein
MDTTVKLGDEINLDPQFSSNFNTISWTGQGNFSCIDCENPTFIPFFDGLITVNIQDENGCKASDSLFLKIDDQSFLILPNIFSPNDDGINDFLTINYYGRSISQIVSFNVYDRWGGLVHSLDQININSGESIWDGYGGANKVEVGVYTFSLRVALINGVEIAKVGNISVIR